MSQKTKKLVQRLFKNEEGEPFILSEGQEKIFDVISQRLYPRTHCMTPTQYGKSITCALAVLTRVTHFSEMWAIVAPTTKKAGIIMGHLIDHIFDNEYISSKFQITRDESFERIRRERRREKITFRLGTGELSGVFIVSTEGKRVKDVLDALMGFGAKNIVLDESGLIGDPQYAGVKRMLGGHKDNFLFEIGNPFRRNHFLKTYRDPNYHKIEINWEKAVAEGRMSIEFINEMRREAFFDVMYEVKFPEEEDIDTAGYMQLWTEKELDRAYVDKIELFGQKRLGIDVGAGQDKSVICLRGKNGAKVVYSTRSSDTMALVGEIMRIKDLEGIKPGAIAIDKTGPGHGAYNRLVEVCGLEIEGVAFGSKPQVEDEYVDRKAEMYRRAKEWTSLGGKLVRNRGWEELLNIKYKAQSDRKMRIKPKELMAREGVHSPDHADALCLTFAKAEIDLTKPSQYRPKWNVGRRR